MGIFDFLAPKSEIRAPIVTEEDLENRKLKANLKRQIMEKEAEKEKIYLEIQIEKASQQLADLRGDLMEGVEDEGGEFNIDKMLMMILTKWMVGQQPGSALIPQPLIPPAAAGPIPEPTPTTAISDTQILEVWAKVPKLNQFAIKRLPEDDIKDLLRRRIPGIDETTLERAYNLIKTH